MWLFSHGYLPINIHHDNKKTPYEIAEEFTASKNDVSITIPKGFFCNLASIHRSLSWFISRTEPNMMRAVAIHDWLYVNHIYSKKECDDIFLDMMKQDNTNYFRRHLSYLGVKYFGKSNYDNPY